ncbi:MAG: hypothetical protein DRP88_07175, partial [Candidatus Neomarinimicrobiota bacterium]
MLFTRKTKRECNNVLKLKNRYMGERCFIVGNGPSLREIDLSKLINEFVFVTNWFVLHDVYKELSYPFLCISDPHLWNYGKGFHEKLVENILKNNNVKCFFEISSKKCVERSPLLDIEVYYLNLNRNKKVWKGEFSKKIWKYVSWGFTVIIDFCLPLVYHLGFSNIYLIGVDCDYNLEKSKNFEKSYFYDISD